MKKLIIIVLFFMSFGVFAQGNLQFNQVKLVSTLETVPVGKVWKVESLIYGENIGGTPYNSSLNQDSGIKINGFWTSTRSTRSVVYASSFYTNWDISLPFWLPAGTTLQKDTNVTYISVMEFNIVF
jgi:hypothetical protein